MILRSVTASGLPFSSARRVVTQTALGGLPPGLERLAIDLDGIGGCETVGALTWCGDAYEAADGGPERVDGRLRGFSQESLGLAKAVSTGLKSVL